MDYVCLRYVALGLIIFPNSFAKRVLIIDDHCQFFRYKVCIEKWYGWIIRSTSLVNT